ncbi:MAG TPA: ATP-grasp domain-containing protein [Methylomirabilota bacterium]|jgi:biotin carboxylase|nr:ATP-grasp domain-containing protein [Methylomirabilota bacterium]
MLRLLLLIPTTTYRTEDFVAAAAKLDVELVIASERPNVLEAARPDNLLTLDFGDPGKAARRVAEFARRHPVDAVVPVDDRTTVVGAAIAERLGLRSSPLEAVSTTRNKHRMRDAFARAGVRSPGFTLLGVSDDAEAAAARVTYPCVLKPTILAGSRGVIRADDPPSFVAAFGRIAKILEAPDVAELGEGREEILVEDFIPGREVALEGLLVGEELHVLALFDKPDPLDGPYFEETIYVTPSRLPPETQLAIAAETRWAARALGLTEGPVHAELRVNDQGPWMVEIAARTIGGLCSRTLRFGAGVSLEELVIRHALGIEQDSLERERRAAGVMMVPIPGGGVLRAVRGREAALAVPGIEDVTISAHVGQELVPLPEGSRYVGFILARAESPAAVEESLREAHRRLAFDVDPPGSVAPTGPVPSTDPREDPYT